MHVTFCPSKRRLIGGTELLIVAQAMALGYTIITDNEREFARIEGLPGSIGFVKNEWPASFLVAVYAADGMSPSRAAM